MKNKFKSVWYHKKSNQLVLFFSQTLKKVLVATDSKVGAVNVEVVEVGDLEYVGEL